MCIAAALHALPRKLQCAPGPERFFHADLLGNRYRKLSKNPVRTLVRPALTQQHSWCPAHIPQRVRDGLGFLRRYPSHEGPESFR